jgi:restriction endonuclease S subunit
MEEQNDLSRNRGSYPEKKGTKMFFGFFNSSKIFNKIDSYMVAMRQCYARFYYIPRLSNDLGRSRQALPLNPHYHRDFRFFLFHFYVKKIAERTHFIYR